MRELQSQGQCSDLQQQRLSSRMGVSELPDSAPRSPVAFLFCFPDVGTDDHFSPDQVHRLVLQSLGGIRWGADDPMGDAQGSAVPQPSCCWSLQPRRRKKLGAWQAA